MNIKKTPLGGMPISRKEAFKGLGNQKTWEKFSEKVYAEFRAKPMESKKSVVRAAVEKVFRRQAGPKAKPVYAKPTKVKSVKTKSSKAKRPKKS
jgi:hypothetical protein